MSDQQPMTIGDIARATGQPEHRVKYAIKRHNIEPAGRVGITRIWRREDLPRIGMALSNTAASPQGRRRTIGGAS